MALKDRIVIVPALIILIGIFFSRDWWAVPTLQSG